jgi:hypothetical protein
MSAYVPLASPFSPTTNRIFFAWRTAKKMETALQKERRHSAVGFLYTLLRRRRRSRPRPARAVPKSASDAGSGTFVGGVVELLNEALI